MLLLITSLYGILTITHAITCGSLTHLNDTLPVTFFTFGPIECNLTFTAPLGLSGTCAMNFGAEALNCTTDWLKFLGDNNSIISGPFCGTHILTATTVSTNITVNFKITSLKRILICNVRQLSTVPTTTPAKTSVLTTTDITSATAPPTTATPSATSSTTTTMAVSTPKTIPCNSISNLNITSTLFKVSGPSNCNFTFNSPMGFSSIYCSMLFRGIPSGSNCTMDYLNLYIGNNFAGGPFCGIWNLTIDTRSTSLTFIANIGSSKSYLVCSVQSSLPTSTTTASTTTPTSTMIASTTTPTSTTTASTTTPTSTMTASTTTPTSTKAVSPTESTSCSCGIVSSSRIIGGTNALPNQYPWQVRLNMFSTNNSGYSLCGGAIISPNYVLTAAHCVEGYFMAKIFIGDYSTTANDIYEVVLNSTTLIKHSGWSPLTLANDIALIRFPSSIAHSPGIQPVCLPFKYVNSSFVGSTCTATGWGRTDDSNGNIANTLQQTNVTVIENVVCADPWINYLLPSMICVQQPGTATCHGDSGGPLGYNEQTGIANQDRTYVIGVVSFGNANGCTLSPNVFTRVTSYLSWIESTTGERFCNI